MPGPVVTLIGEPGQQDHDDLIPVAVRLIWDIDGVVDVPTSSVRTITTELAEGRRVRLASA